MTAEDLIILLQKIPKESKILFYTESETHSEHVQINYTTCGDYIEKQGLVRKYYDVFEYYDNNQNPRPKSKPAFILG